MKKNLQRRGTETRCYRLRMSRWQRDREIFREKRRKMMKRREC